MDYIAIGKATGLSFLFLVVAFVPMEKVFPARKGQPFFRKGWVLDFCFFVGQYFVWGYFVLTLLTEFSFVLDDIVPASFREGVAGQPWWLQAIELVFLSDLIIYWAHRLQHRVGFLWRFHKVHHSAERLDWLAAHREHPLDSIYTIGLINLPFFIAGFPVASLIGLLTFRGIWAIYIHSNVRLPIGPLKKLIGAPELHHWHHDKDRDAGNYANVSPLMDLLFGTYVCPDHEPEAFGIHEVVPQNYAGQLLEPMLPKKLSDKLLLEKKSPLKQILKFFNKNLIQPASFFMRRLLKGTNADSHDKKITPDRTGNARVLRPGSDHRPQ